jgi:hypothetical protein
MPDYTKWPIGGDVLSRLASAGITPRDVQRIPDIVTAVAKKVTHQTRRQFIADTVASARLYDGSGTVEIEIDEFISLSSMQILGYVGVASAITVTSPVVCQDQDLPQTRVLLFSGTTPIYAGIYIDKWPEGYRNIQATCVWGYAATIPADLWEAVAEQSAKLVAIESQSSARGVITELREGDVLQKFAVAGVDSPLWDKGLREAIKDYTRPLGRRLRRLRAPMI